MDRHPGGLPWWWTWSMVDARGRARARGRVARNPKLRIRQISRERGVRRDPSPAASPSRRRRPPRRPPTGPRGPGLEVPGDESAEPRRPFCSRSSFPNRPRGYRLHARRTSPATCGGRDGAVNEVLESERQPLARCTAASSSPVQYRSVSPTNDASFIASEERARGAKWRGTRRVQENNNLETTTGRLKSHDCLLWPLGQNQRQEDCFLNVGSRPCLCVARHFDIRGPRVPHQRQEGPTPRRPRPKPTPRTRRTPRSKPRRTIQCPRLTWTRASPRSPCPRVEPQRPRARVCLLPCGRTSSRPRARGVPATSCSTASSVSDSRTSASGASSATAATSST